MEKQEADAQLEMYAAADDADAASQEQEVVEHVDAGEVEY